MFSFCVLWVFFVCDVFLFFVLWWWWVCVFCFVCDVFCFLRGGVIICFFLYCGGVICLLVCDVFLFCVLCVCFVLPVMLFLFFV